MKIKPLFLLVLTSALIGCANQSEHANNAGNSLYYSMLNSESSNKDLSSLDESSDISSASQIELPTYDQIDLDLSEIDAAKIPYTYYDMEDYPNNYLSKIIKVSGPFMPYGSVDPSSCYPAIFLFGDSTGCCAYCLEFLLYGVPTCSPQGGDGYPLLNEEATVVGRFEKYYEGTSCYIHLVDAIWLKD